MEITVQEAEILRDALAIATVEFLHLIRSTENHVEDYALHRYYANSMEVINKAAKIAWKE